MHRSMPRREMGIVHVPDWGCRPMPAGPSTGDRHGIGAAQVSNQSSGAQRRRTERIAMKALVLRLAALALPILLFAAAAAPRISW